MEVHLLDQFKDHYRLHLLKLLMQILQKVEELLLIVTSLLS